MSLDDELYGQFVEAYLEKREGSISQSWSKDLRERCKLFLKLAGTLHPSASVSILSTLTTDGVEADVTLTTTDPVPPPSSPTPEGGVPLDRYVVEEEIARGGMGRILLAYDRDFRRRIAMKVLLTPQGQQQTVQTSRFFEEAQATAQLEHPNIGPVYDIGVDDKGAPFFTMKWIRGRNLAEILESTDDELTLIRLVQILQQVAMGVDFAHSRGVVHRDLKPENIMVGDYGEVLVMDWGVAKILGRSREPDTTSAEDTVQTSRSERGIHTLRGSLQGSLAFMSPEQAQGDVDAIDARTDVFGLGAILYVILTGAVPYTGRTARELLGKAKRGEIEPLRSARREIPPALEAICLRALALRKEDRFATARDLHNGLQEYVEGIHDAERRRAEGARLFEEAERKREDWQAAVSAEEALRGRAETLKRDLGNAAQAEKEPLWELVEAERDAREKSSRLLNETLAAYHSTLSADEGNAEARERLAGLYYDRMVEAEARGERETAHVYENLVTQQQHPKYQELLQGEEFVQLRTSPEGATVLLSRYEEKGLRLVASTPEKIGTTPLAVQLPRGSYLCSVRLDGYATTLYPLLVGRNERVDETLELQREGAIPSGFLQIPGGVSIVGGDPKLFSAVPRRSRRFDGFFVQRLPVTLEQYCEFLTEYFAGKAPSEKELYRIAPFFNRDNMTQRTGEGAFEPDPKYRQHSPVVAVSLAAASEYSSWLGKKLGRSGRLLTEMEWERCARGADGRTYPWGNDFDWTFCHGAPSHTSRGILPVGSFGDDCSPFEIRDLAGGVRELCQRTADDHDFPLKGGSWYYNLPFLFRCDSRTMSSNDDFKSWDIGFRVCLD